MSIPCSFASHQDAKKAGWFSRRHQTDAAHRAAQVQWQAERDEKLAREQEQRAAHREFMERLQLARVAGR